MDDVSLTEFGVLLAGARRDVDIWDLVKRFFAARGVKRIGYHHLDPVSSSKAIKGPTVYAEGFPDDWVCHYVRERLVRVDPIPELAMRTGRMFRWKDVTLLASVSEAQKNFLSLLKEADMGDGLAIPLFGPQMRNGYLGLGFVTRELDLTLDQEIELRMGAQMAHQRYCEILTERSNEILGLAPREREILEWIAHGKSNAVIAQILSISPHTVDTLVRRIFAKLEAGDRTTAVLKGLSRGVVQLGQGRAA